MAANEFGVGVIAESIVVLRLPTGRLTKEQALNFAAWLVAVAGCVSIDEGPEDARKRFEALYFEAMSS